MIFNVILAIDIKKARLSTFVATPPSPMPTPTLEALQPGWLSQIFHIKPAVRSFPNSLLLHKPFVIYLWPLTFPLLIGLYVQLSGSGCSHRKFYEDDLAFVRR